ncbi:hypothetical protein [Massilia endophytica]|uniref:hypothetical protein n=1 Tax=Massilia endophytica TaxID=2899220 RepID=UPI001E31F432|nr:hypothetical protein [Massilia endophytica]UGQ46878.1 hypothetical protein LSQ66_24480 [Massilia endophytica]
MKKLLAVTVIALLAIAAFNSIDTHDMVFHWDGEEVDGPLEALLAMLFAGGGLVIAAIAVTCAAVFVGLLFAGLGILMVVGLALLGIVLAAAIAPFLLPLLIPLAIFWAIRKRNKRVDLAKDHATA